jgi:hypothetical protein
MHMIFKFTPETDAQSPLKLKVEINTREHRSALGVPALRTQFSLGVLDPTEGRYPQTLQPRILLCAEDVTLVG